MPDSVAVSPVWKALFQIGKEIRVALEVNEFNIVLGCWRFDGKRKNHRQFFPGIERHAIDQILATLVSGTRKDVCGMDRADGLRKTTHNHWGISLAPIWQNASFPASDKPVHSEVKP